MTDFTADFPGDGAGEPAAVPHDADTVEALETGYEAGLEAGLASLIADPPDTLIDRIAGRWVRVPSPLGDLYVASTDQGIAYVRPADEDDEFEEFEEFGDGFHERFDRPLVPADRPPAGLLPALRTGRSTGLRFDLRWLSPFEESVLRVTLTIPKGQVRPYSWVAESVGRRAAVRAVGSALGRNPVPVLIPCHRVVRSDGEIGGYIFGPAAKRALLGKEGVDVDGIRALGRRHVHYLASDTTGVVCFPTCPNARRITSPHRHGFRTVAEAEDAGYRPCRSCRPDAARV
ncbi:MAG: methylated-DNA--[protein]-cysteine S-methyltransferase [Mycobacteriales bacterium]